MIPRLGVSRIGLLKSFVFSLLILVAGAVAFSMKYPHSPLWVMWLVIAFIAVWATKVPLLVKGVAVEFTSQGLTDHTNGLGFVAWPEIASVRTRSPWFGEFVELEIKDRGTVLSRLGWLKALMVKTNLRQGRPGFSINAGWVSGGAEAIFTNLRTLAPGIQIDEERFADRD
jgi:hypothetical protein